MKIKGSFSFKELLKMSSSMEELSTWLHSGTGAKPVPKLRQLSWTRIQAQEN